jgi:hypothetical protein
MRYLIICTEQRKLDVTCCDVSIETLARNAIAYTLIADDISGVQSELIWCIYYDVRLPADALRLLQTQAQKLSETAKTIEAWNDCPYSRYIRFCDLSTFKRVAALWTYYSVDQSELSKFHDQQQSLKKRWQTAKEHHEDKAGAPGIFAMGVRSTAPFFHASMGHLGRSHKIY